MRHGRRDLTHAEIRDHLRDLGASVVDLGDVGRNIPDLLVGFCDHDFLVEAKSAKGELSEGQSEFAKAWRGQTPIVLRTKEAAREWYLRKRHELTRASDPKMLAAGTSNAHQMGYLRVIPRENADKSADKLEAIK